MRKRINKRGRPKIKCSPRNERTLGHMIDDHVARAQDAVEPHVEPELSAKRRDAAKKRWDSAKISQLDLTAGVECEIFAHVEESSDEDVDIVNNGGGDVDIDKELNLPKTSSWRHWKSFQDYLPSDLDLQAALLRATQTQLKYSCLVIKETGNPPSYTGSKATFYRMKTKILNHISSLQPSVSRFLILKWGQTLALEDLHLLDYQGIFFDSEDDIPRECLAQLLCDQILSKMRADLKTKIMKSFNTKLVVEVAEGLVRHASQHGDAASLARVTGVSQRFASRVLEAVRNGDQLKLFTRERRRDSIIGSGILERFRDFISQPEQSRECPGTTISVAYKKREPKHLLIKSKPALCQEFLSLNEDIRVKKSVLMRDFPR